MEMASLIGEGEHRLSELAELRNVDQSVISRQIGDLRPRVWSAGGPDPADRRASLVRLTPDGLLLLERARAAAPDLAARRAGPHPDRRRAHRRRADHGADRRAGRARRRLRPAAALSPPTPRPRSSRKAPPHHDHRHHRAARRPAEPRPVGSPAGSAPAEYTHREILTALSGLLLAMFVAILSSTIVSNALPTIISDLHGSQTGYTWVVTATLLTTTVTTPIWGKLADLLSKKLLVQIAITIFILGSVGAGLAGSIESLIGWRAVQGVGAGGLQALAQVIIAVLIPPRERGRYSGYLGAVLAAATVSGPLAGGLLVDTPALGWRWCFFVGVPIGLIALVVLQRTLRIPTPPRDRAGCGSTTWARP